MTELVKELGAARASTWVRLHYVYPYPHVDEVHPADGRGQGAAVPRRAVPALASARAEGDEAAGVRREEHRAHPRLARDLPGAHDPLDLHRRLSGRDRGRVRAPAGLPARGRTRSGRLLRLFAGRRRGGQRAARAACRTRCARNGARASCRCRRQISARRLARKVGTVQRVLVDEVGPTVAMGRTAADAPEIDGVVYVKTGRRKLSPGDFVDVKITSAEEHDLHGAARMTTKLRAVHGAAARAPPASK